MKLKLLKAVVVKGCPGITVGDVFECPDNIGRDFVIEGLAEVATVEPAKVEPVQTREPEVEHRDPVIESKPKRAKKKLP